MPVSEPEIKADRDRLRAEYAIKVHKLETQLEQAKLERARQLIDINRRDASISTLETDVVQLKADLEENQNARRVLEQTVTDRLPRVEARLAEAKRLLFNRDREIAELTAGARRHKQALEEVSSINAQKNAQIERLSTALTTRGGRGRQAAGDAADAEVALRSEIEALRSKSSEQALLIDRLAAPIWARLRADHTRRLRAARSRPTATRTRRGETFPRRRRRSARCAPQPLPARAAPSPSSARSGRSKRARRTKPARSPGLKAALVAFEQQDGKAGGLKDSRIALRARLGSAQAQADQQAATIAKLRAELAATHERLARQAAHFMGEMRRIGGGQTTAPGQVRRPVRGDDRRTLADRVAQVRAGGRPTERTETRPTTTPEPEARRIEAPAAAANGHNANGSAGAAAGKKEAAASGPALPAAAEMPKAGEIPRSAVGLACSIASPVWPKADRKSPAHCGVGSRPPSAARGAK